VSADWRPTADADALRLRAGVNARIRAFFAARDVLEVETPMLSAGGNTDPNLRSFRTDYSGPVHGGEAPRWLRTSPEHALKRLLCAGIGDCFELGRVFRDGESGRRHNPEFTMLEWYRVGWDHHALMDEVAALVAEVMSLAAREVRVRRTSYRDLFRERLGLDPFTAPIDELRAPLDGFAIEARGLERDDWLDLLVTHRLQPDFAPGELRFVHGFPPSQCALARVAGFGEDAVAERFEAFLGSQELANGYHELCDADEQRTRFERDLARRRARGLDPPRVDERFLAALRAGLPACAGVALGIERLLLAMRGADDLSEVLAFPFSRA
jgi:lysyl-tRNA synthetase class 2